MKKLVPVLVCTMLTTLLGACSTEPKQPESERYTKKIYLTKEDYMEDLDHSAKLDRRELAPNVESEYIFNVLPDTETNVYFFDKRQQPKVPGIYTANDYKHEKRLWTKPKRYTPEQYYGMQGGDNSSESSSSSSNYDY